MKGIELCEKFYNEFGRDMIETDFKEVSSKIAVGIAGYGSECFGFDDELSQDHDFEPGFCLWLTKKDYELFGFELEKMYARLPKEYQGFKRLTLSPVGGGRHGVMIIDDFYKTFLGSPNAPCDLFHWLSIPPCSLACACNGKVFSDPLQEFSKIRNTLLGGYPFDVRLKKIAAHTIMMAQSGLYNYRRCVLRGETGSAYLCIFEFVKNAISLVYLLNNAYEPFYKWAFKGMRKLNTLSCIEPLLIKLMEMDSSLSDEKYSLMEEICRLFVCEFKNKGITTVAGDNFEKHAYSIQNSIKNPDLRNMHIMDGI